MEGLYYCQTCWRDLKSRTSKKAAALRVARRKTGNSEIDLPPLTALDNKVLGIMGWDYAEGMAECPDAFPEEQDQAIDKLMGGDDSILNALPVSMTAREGDMPDPMLLQDEIELPVVIEVLEDAAPVEQGESPSVATKRKGWQERPLSGQFRNAREKFTALASRNEDNMERLAMAVEGNTEATKGLQVLIEKQVQVMQEAKEAISEQAKANNNLAAAIVMLSTEINKN
ncbi:uncharacterized protein LOC124173670 [Ischnura elegans]|uniref:uncharacterized protein LOC124173670 n=1 Tax=Ischnura elegans TaxID=197161 RepID=UPI001ED87A7C|nr:uncharacterized protein LOC124173670 [Ischnura elegans]